MDKLLVPIIILLSASIISIIVIMLSGKKKNKKIIVNNQDKDIDLMKSESNILPDMKEKESSVLPIVPIEDNQILPDVPMNKDINNNTLPNENINTIVLEPKQPQVIKKVVVVKKEEPSGPLPVVDIPVPDTSDTAITVEEVKSIVDNNQGEIVPVEEVKTLEENVNNDELITVDESTPLTNEMNNESIVVEEAKPLQNDIGENVTVEEIKQVTNDLGETAFKSLPDGNTSINSNIKVEPIQDNFAKTEIFSLDDIKEELNRIEENKRDNV